MKKSRYLLLNLIVLSLFYFSSVLANPSGAEPSVTRSAHQVYMDLLESSVSFRAVEVRPNGESAPVTFGAEKEGSSQLITRVMGPSGMAFQDFLQMESLQFRREFMKRFVNGSSRVRSVVDVNGVNVSLTQSELSSLRGNYDQMTETQLDSKIEKFIEITKDRPFSYLTKTERKKLFKGQTSHQRRAIKNLSYFWWTPNFGLPQKYIANAHGAHSTSVGWEINFNPVNSYGEFERFISWFKESLKNAGKLFQAPGHQRIVFPTPDRLNLTEPQKAQWHNKMSDLMRNVQAYIIVRGILGNTGIENASYKKVHTDRQLNLYDSLRGENGRGVIRYDRAGRFVQDTYSVELRAGTKDAHVQQFIEQVITARAGTGEVSDLKGLSEYKLFTGNPPNANEISSRFQVSKEVAEKFLENSRRAMSNQSFNVALWNWKNAPYMKGKENVLRWATRNYITIVANTTDTAVIKKALRKWIRTVGVDTSIKEYIRPQRLAETMERLHHHRSTGRVNVNNIDLGIEYSARFANKYSTELSERPGSDGKKIWLNTKTGMTPHERKVAIRNMAISLGYELNGRNVAVTDVSTAGAHGHGLSIAFKVKDAQGRSWRVEWDGVGREYNSRGEVVPESLRGGHMEIVTPKFTPTHSEMQAVYRAMSTRGLIPMAEAGGGHINIDLAPFKGKPEALARFLTLFHEHRGVISFMFQNVNRSSAAQPAEVSERLARELRNFTGTETQLKRLLYNERYFNMRLGRKTRNMHVDMSGYFQDVIPARHIHQDFDMKNPSDPWRPQFRVDPNIRKMEFRMFDAPIDAFESAMQIKLIRAMLNAALNETGQLSGRVQEVNHEKYASNYELAEQKLTRMCRALGLEVGEFRMFLARAANQVNKTLTSSSFKTYEQKIAEYGWREVRRTEVWGEALSYERSSTRAIGSDGRQWNGTALPEAEEFRQRRLQAAREGEQMRENHTPDSSTRRELKIGVNCRSVFGL